MEDLIKTLRVGNIFCLMHVGNMPKEKCMYSTKLFAEKVLPKLRNMFPDYAATTASGATRSSRCSGKLAERSRSVRGAK